MRRLGVVAVASLALVAGAHGSGAGVEVVAKITVGAQACSVVMAADSAWVAVFGTDEVVRIDPATNRVVRRIRVGGSPGGLAISRSAVWVGNFAQPSIARIDPRRNRVVKRVRVGEKPVW